MVDITNQPPDPLRIDVRIANQEGKPTQEFLRQWNQQRVINVTVDDIVVDLTALQADVTALEAEVDDIQDVDIVAGVGLDGGGNISGPTDVTIDLADTAVTPGTYGNATNSAQVTIDQQGRITAAANIPITGGGGGSGSGGGGTPPTRTSQALSGAGPVDVSIPAGCTWFKFAGVDIVMASSSGTPEIQILHTGGTVIQTQSGIQETGGAGADLSGVNAIAFSPAASGTSRDVFGTVISPRSVNKTISQGITRAGGDVRTRNTLADAANDDDTIRFVANGANFSSGTVEIEFFYN